MEFSMEKLFLTIISACILFSCSSAFSSNYGHEAYMLRNKSWEGYGKLNNSYKYGKHRFDFDNSDKVVHSINNNFEKLYKWNVNYSGTFQMVEDNHYSWKDVELEIINSYTIKLDGLELRRVYN